MHNEDPTQQSIILSQFRGGTGYGEENGIGKLELENWKIGIGKVGDWEIGKLGDWEIGKLENWEMEL